MVPLRALPVAGDGAMLPTPLLLRWLAGAADEVELIDLPWLNGGLPTLLRLGGIGRLAVHQRLPVPALHWDGLGGGRVMLNAVDDELPVHHGPLPAGAWPTLPGGDDLHAAVELARLEDANAVIGLGDGADWEALLAQARTGLVSRPPPLATRGGRGAAGYAAWNPLPFARRLVAALPLATTRAPWALLHPASGAMHPAQVVEGPVGRELLVELPLGGLAGARLEPADEPAPGPAWEVSEDVLDNGLVRAELDVFGQVERLCFAGAFVELAGPLVRPALEGVPLRGSPAVVRVLEDGPVRARVVVARDTGAGTLHVTYTLHAHESLLRVNVAWDGDAAAELTLEHPTVLRHHDLLVAGELAGERRGQAASILHPPDPATRGCRWAALPDGRGGGLVALAERPFAAGARGGILALAGGRGGLAYALGDLARTDPARAALALAVPGRASSAETDLAPLLRLAGGDGVAPLWIHRPEDAVAELLLVEQRQRRARLWLQPTRPATAAWRVDARGRRLAEVARTPDGDLQIDLNPGEPALVRWQE